MGFKKTVMVDLDATLLKYDVWKGEDHFGEPCDEYAVEFTKELSKFAKIVIFTTRCSVNAPGRKEGVTPEQLRDKVKAVLDKYGFYYDEIYIGQGKPLCAAFIDDRNVCIDKNPNKNEYLRALDWAKYLCEH